MNRTPVTFTNRNGQRLVGMLERPDGPGRDAGLAVILLSPGVKMRVGPQRLYRRLSQQFVDLGIPVLRFDFYGLGDSEGDVNEELLRDVYNHIEVGRFVNDTIDAMNWMASEFGIQRFLLSGLCGGAVTGLLAAAQDRRVAGLVSLGITPTLASHAANPALYMTSGELSAMRETYLSKIFRPQAWWRLLTFQSDYTLLWRALSQPFRRPKATASPGTAPPAERDNANPLFPPAFFSAAAAGCQMLLVFGGADRLHWEFEEKFVARHRDRLAECAGYWTVHVIPNANHTLSFPEWQEQMLDTVRTWLAEHLEESRTLETSVAG